MKLNWPKSSEQSYEHYYLPKHLKNVLLLADLHIPYHHIAALDEAVNYGITKKIDSIVLNGDIIDCYMLSKFQPDPEEREFWKEIESFKEFIKTLKKAFPNALIFYKLGNHEERYEKFMLKQCSQFLGINQFEFENVLGCAELNIEVIKDQRIIYIGNLPCFHGHELHMRSVSVNPARTLFLKTHVSAICSHLHRTSSHTEPSLDEDITCWSTGHLSEAHPKYARINKWNWGCARVEKDEDGNFEVINVNLTQNKLYRT